jgi:hypothetical protein
MIGDWLSLDGHTLVRALLDVGLAALVGLLAWRLRRDSEPQDNAAWDERERRLRAVHESLHRLVERAQEDARVLDARLAAQVAHVESSLRSAEAVIEAIRAPRVARAGGAAAEAAAEAAPPAPARPAAGATGVAERVSALADEDLSAEEIARRVDLPIADVRFLLALAARAQSTVGAGA